MLEEEEILQLAKKGINGPAWSLYCALKSHCYLPKKGGVLSPVDFMCYPSQLRLHEMLGWPELKLKKDGSGSVFPSSPCRRAMERLEEHGLIKVYRGKDSDLPAIAARKLLRLKLRSTHRNGKGLSGGRQHIYRLIFWEQLKRVQIGRLREDTSDLSTEDTSVESEATNLSSKADEGNYIKNNKNTIINNNEEIRDKINNQEGTLRERVDWFHSQMDRDANTAESWLWGLENTTSEEELFRGRYFYWVGGGTL